MNSLFLNNTAVGDGGGIAEGGALTSITSSEIDGNYAGNGGAILANGTTLFVQASTMANNVAGNGGGIELDTVGAGLAAGSTITNTTITGNTALNNAGADGGGLDAGAGFTGALLLLNDTINANAAIIGGGVFWAGSAGSIVSLENTIIAGNSASNGPDAGTNLPVTDLGGNLIGVSGAGSGNTGFGAATQTGTVARPLDPLLGSLQNNGGPTIGASGTTITLQTEQPEAGSPAIGKGLLARAPTVDERGFPSVVNSKINVGAVSTSTGATLTTGPITALVGLPFTGTVATLTVPGGGASSTLTATINWGDGTTSAGTVSGSAGTYTISGTHTYTQDGHPTITVSAALTGGSSSIATGAATANVANDNLKVTALAISATARKAFSGAVATFTDPGASATDTYSATINWGDGKTSSGTVTKVNGTWTVSGTHTYATHGPFTVTVAVTENGISQAQALFTAKLTGTQEVPAVTTPGTGTATILLSTDLSTITFNQSISNLTALPTDSQLSVAPAGQNGPLATDIYGNHIEFAPVPDATTGAFAQQTFLVNTTFLTQLFLGDIYTNVESYLKSTGEIRGQFALTSLTTGPATASGSATATVGSAPAAAVVHAAPAANTPPLTATR